MENLEPRVSLILVLLETETLEAEAPSVEVSEDVSGARITGSFFFPSVLSEDFEAMTFRFRCLKLIKIILIDLKAEVRVVYLSVLQ